MKLYSLRDVKAGVYGGILMAMNDGHMSRILAERFAGSEETVAKFPDDFELYEVGEFDTDTGAMVGAVKFVCSVGLVLKPGGLNA